MDSYPSLLQIKEQLVHARTLLRREDQELYPEDDLEKHLTHLETRVSTSCQSPQPVLDAYIDACINVHPRRCYMVHGMKRQTFDPYIVSF